MKGVRECRLQVCYLEALFAGVVTGGLVSRLAQASATARRGLLPGDVAQPPSVMKSSCFQLSAALSLTRVAGASAAFWNLSAQIGASATTTALSTFSALLFSALLCSCQPPKPKPRTSVRATPAAKPCRRRLSDSPLSMSNILYPFRLGREDHSSLPRELQYSSQA